MTYDIIGNKKKAVAIIDKKSKRLVENIMKRHKNVKSVLYKSSSRGGVYRIYKLKLIKGSKNTEVIHKEYGCIFKLDPKKVYFSPRESSERQRIANMVKKNEEVLVMFSGISPYGILIGKKCNCKIKCVDINPDAVKYADENVRLNKLINIKNYCGDVRKVCKNFGKFNRIIMPLPESAIKFLDLALEHSKKNGIIHLYVISRENTKKFENKIKRIAEKCKKKIKIVKIQRVLPYSPYKYKFRFDIKVL